MKKIYYLIVLAMTLYALQVMATETVPGEFIPGWNAITPSSLKTNISYLTSRPLEGRLALSKGDNLAIAWIAKQFAGAGLLQGNGLSYLQPVPLIEYVPDREKSYIALEQAGVKTVWKKPDVLTEFRHDVTLKGEVVFVGYGITAPDLHYDDYQQVDVRGKIVLMFEHEPQETKATSIFNGTANTIYATNRIKALNAENHGAIAVLIAPEPNRHHPSNLERYLRVGGTTQRATPIASMVLADDTLHIPVATLSDKVAKAIAGKQLSLSHLQAAIDRDLLPHSSLISHAKIRWHDQNKSSKNETSYNVVGYLEGNDPILKNETIIISAHHDHDGKDGQQIWYGADDNASGTAGVVAVAHALAINNRDAAGLKLKRSVLFVVFAAEERGLLGAYYLAAHPLPHQGIPCAMINFDMIGRNETPSTQTDGIIDIPKDTTNRLNLIGSHYSPDYSSLVANENKYVGLTLDNRFDTETALNVFFRSDQFPFILQNVPAFWWFTGFHPDYHHTTDTADKINYAKMQKILRLAYLSTYTFANEKVPPQFVKNPGL